MGACDEAFGVSLGETAPSADLGGSSKYSNENFEGRSGEGRDRDAPLTQALPRLSKGNGVNIPQPRRGYCMAT